MSNQSTAEESQKISVFKNIITFFFLFSQKKSGVKMNNFNVNEEKWWGLFIWSWTFCCQLQLYSLFLNLARDLLHISMGNWLWIIHQTNPPSLVLWSVWACCLVLLPVWKKRQRITDRESGVKEKRWGLGAYLMLITVCLIPEANNDVMGYCD